MRCPMCGGKMKEEYYDKYPAGHGGMSYIRCLDTKNKHHKWWTCEEAESDSGIMVVDVTIRAIDRNQFYKDIRNPNH